MQTGMIKSLKIDRGFGFIEPQAGRDIFFHCRDLAPSLSFDETLECRRVSFDVRETDKGPRAVNVCPAL